jgi:hypothetical protein
VGEGLSFVHRRKAEATMAKRRAKYTFREHFHVPADVKAQKVGEEIKSIIDASGDQPTARMVLEKAHDQTTELFKCFEWRDRKAAAAYRLRQAGEILRSIEIEIIDVKGRPYKERAFHVVYQDGPHSEGVYMPIEYIVEDEDATQTVLRRAYRDWQALARKYQHLKEFISVIQAVQNLPPLRKKRKSKKRKRAKAGATT